MKLYATTTSERASKGQGGNKYLFIDIQAGEDRKIIAKLYVNNESITIEHYDKEYPINLIDYTKAEKKKAD
jgi:hypothetical protein